MSRLYLPVYAAVVLLGLAAFAVFLFEPQVPYRVHGVPVEAKESVADAADFWLSVKDGPEIHIYPVSAEVYYSAHLGDPFTMECSRGKYSGIVSCVNAEFIGGE